MIRTVWKYKNLSAPQIFFGETNLKKIASDFGNFKFRAFKNGRFCISKFSIVYFTQNLRGGKFFIFTLCTTSKGGKILKNRYLSTIKLRSLILTYLMTEMVTFLKDYFQKLFHETRAFGIYKLFSLEQKLILL